MKKLTLQYLIFLGVLTVAICASQLLIQHTISDSKTDSRIINISGRQRMLSQKITKAALALPLCQSKESFNRTKNELTDAARLWVDSHHALQHGNATLDVSRMNQSVYVERIFTQIQPYFLSINEAVNVLTGISYDQLNSEKSMSIVQESVQKITDNETDFLKLMNDITFEYDRIAAEKVKRISNYEFYLLAGTLLLILLEAIFIFRPLIKTSKRKDYVISEFNDYVQQSISELGNNHRQRLKSEEIIEEANEKIKHLTSLNNSLRKRLRQSKREFDKKLNEEILSYTEISELNTVYENKINHLERELSNTKKSS